MQHKEVTQALNTIKSDYAARIEWVARERKEFENRIRAMVEEALYDAEKLTLPTMKYDARSESFSDTCFIKINGLRSLQDKLRCLPVNSKAQKYLVRMAWEQLEERIKKLEDVQTVFLYFMNGN